MTVLFQKETKLDLLAGVRVSALQELLNRPVRNKVAHATQSAMSCSSSSGTVPGLVPEHRFHRAVIYGPRGLGEVQGFLLPWEGFIMEELQFFELLMNVHIQFFTIVWTPGTFSHDVYLFSFL